MDTVLVNGRQYRVPRAPVVVICVDGWDPAYLRGGIASGHLSFVASLYAHGFVALASAVMPTFTNPNNASIVTGVTPAEHGIQGNYFYDRNSGREVMVNDASYLRTPTILAALEKAGARVGIVTAKDKLKSIVAAGLNGFAVSAEVPADDAAANSRLRPILSGLPPANKYSAELSYYALEVAVRIVQAGEADVLYVSLSDYVQHKHAPGHPAANEFFGKLDATVKELTRLGAIVGMTADHGMNDKSARDGKPNVLYLEDELERRFGPERFKVICPITDPYVRHHGALGSFARIYACRDGIDLHAAQRYLEGLHGVQCVLDRRSAAEDLDLPFDLEADLAVVSVRDFVLGSRRATHDLSAIDGARLRSHGGTSELVVPFIINAPIKAEYALRSTRRGLRNFDIFDYVLNGVDDTETQ